MKLLLVWTPDDIACKVTLPDTEDQVKLVFPRRRQNDSAAANSLNYTMNIIHHPQFQYMNDGWTSVCC